MMPMRAVKLYQRALRGTPESLLVGMRENLRREIGAPGSPCAAAA